jgi:hypothetical protein
VGLPPAPRGDRSSTDASSKLTQPFIEQIGVVTAAINEGLATECDGLLRIAATWPAGWSASGTVFIQGRSQVHVAGRDPAVCAPASGE